MEPFILILGSVEEERPGSGAGSRSWSGGRMGGEQAAP